VGVTATTAYRDFLEAKVPLAVPAGISSVTPGLVNPWCKPHAKDAVAWAVRGGRRAIFASFGLHKTSMQLEWMRLTLEARTIGVGLIVLPLNVRREFLIEAGPGRLNYDDEMFPRFVRTDDEVDDALERGRARGYARAIFLTNYESVREGKIDPTRFNAVSLDEASILRGMGGTKTFREFMGLFEHTDTPRLVATATPSPNDYIELLAYAAFLGIMDVGQAKTRFFKRDSEHADELTLHPHKEEEFWLWVASWALFISKPSDLGHSDEGYILPPLDLRWHEVDTDHSGAGADRDGQGRLLRDAAVGVVDASREKRDSLPTRLAKLLSLRAEDPGAHRLLWHDLEAERAALEAAIPGLATVYGTQDLDEREQLVADFSEGKVAELAGKPVMLGSGCNLQRYCRWAIYFGIGFKFNDFIQSIFRLQRFGQTGAVRVDLIYTEAEREVRKILEEKWRRHEAQVARMTEIVRKYGLAQTAMAATLTRSLGVTRTEKAGRGWVVAHNDCVDETARLQKDSLGLVVTSWPFSNQYEYSPSYNDFGHTDNSEHFFKQMDYLTPEVYRALKPGRLYVVHVKDRIQPGGLTGLGFQTVQPFHADCIYHLQSHGFAYLGMKTIVTDVVRENAQTYRLGWTEQCKDGSRMGCGMPEYLLLFRKPPTDPSRGYADEPVVKSKAAYSRARWQFDAHGFMRSSGDRLLMPEDLNGLAPDAVFKLFKRHSAEKVYDHEHDVRIAEHLETLRMLPPSFMLLQPQSWHDDVWTDVTRMRTLNGVQAAKGREMHLCPLQFDIVDRAIVQYTMEGEEVYDPFGGLMTVPLRAVRLKRCGRAAELSASYFADGVWHLEQQDAEHATPSLFDALETAAPPPDKPAVEFYRDGSLGPTPEPKRKEPIWP
jgi:hypothetical protein